MLRERGCISHHKALYGWLLENRPELARRTIFVTGGARTGRVAAFLESVGDLVVLEKRVSREDLLASLETALRG